MLMLHGLLDKLLPMQGSAMPKMGRFPIEKLSKLRFDVV
jgi:hypothetical protein